MIIDKTLLDELTQKATENPRLRQAMDLRTTPDDGSQRILNAMEPGTELPIHRHRFSTETVVVLRGAVEQHFYNDEGVETDCIRMAPGTDCVGMSVPVGQWHRSVALQPGTVIFEAKDGPYQPLSEIDVLK